jgi:hypothetical protein
VKNCQRYREFFGNIPKQKFLIRALGTDIGCNASIENGAVQVLMLCWPSPWTASHKNVAYQAPVLTFTVILYLLSLLVAFRCLMLWTARIRWAGFIRGRCIAVARPSPMLLPVTTNVRVQPIKSEPACGVCRQFQDKLIWPNKKKLNLSTSAARRPGREGRSG